MPITSLPPLALYIHIPWCVRKCPYCDFNSHQAPVAIPQEEYVAALLADLEQDLPAVWGRPITSIFFGGGTPSLFTPDNIERIIEGVSARLTLRPALEVTLETNPGTIEHGQFSGYRRAGVNRISLGVQSFADAALQRIGRIHDGAQAQRALQEAQDADLSNINIDLMYALPQQTLAQALHDVELAISLNPTHISHYQLTLEPNTPFAAQPPPLPDSDAAFDMQDQCQTRLAAAGFEQYEVSAYARLKQRCAHNENYWRYGDYLGIGAGAHAKITDAAAGLVRRTWKVKHPRSYLQHAATVLRLGGDEIIPQEQLPFEFMLNNLRLIDGFAIPDFEARTGIEVSHIQPHLDAAIARGWLEQHDDHLRATALGQRFLNNVIELFLPQARL